MIDIPCRLLGASGNRKGFYILDGLRRLWVPKDKVSFRPDPYNRKQVICTMPEDFYETTYCLAYDAEDVR